MLHRLAVAALLVAVPFAPALAQSEPAHPDPVILTPDQVKWNGPAGGNQTALFLGDTRKPGPFITVQNWISGVVSQPHYHPKQRTFIVLKGHWDFGWGPKYDLAAMRALPEGSVVTVPAGGIIYDGCKQAPCVVETVGDGVDPEFMVDASGKTIAPMPAAAR
jgi:hypothetical protein